MWCGVCGALAAAVVYVCVAGGVSESSMKYILYFQEQGANVPQWFLDRFEETGTDAAYVIAYDVSNPFYLRGDWDGDGRADLAVRVRHRESGATSIAFARRAASSIDMPPGETGPTSSSGACMNATYRSGAVSAASRLSCMPRPSTSRSRRPRA